MVTSLPSHYFRLTTSVSLSLSPIVPHAQYRKRFRASYIYIYTKRGSASYIVREVLLVRGRERERDTKKEREIDGSDVNTVALKLAMNLHFPLPKNRTIGDEPTLFLAKNSHFSFLPSHFPSLPSRRGHHGGAEIRNEFTLSIAKNFFALGLCSPLFQMARAARRVIENPRQKIKSCPVLFCSSHRKIESN